MVPSHGYICEPRLTTVLFYLVPPFVCTVNYLVIVSLAVFATFYPLDTPAKIMFSMLGSIGTLMIPFWYRTFFDKDYIGADRPLSVQWSPFAICFRGAYFQFEVSLNDIVSFRELSGLWHKCLLVRVRKQDGKIHSLYLSTTMRDKQIFAEFLTKHMDVGRQYTE